MRGGSPIPGANRRDVKWARPLDRLDRVGICSPAQPRPSKQLKSRYDVKVEEAVRRAQEADAARQKAATFQGKLETTTAINPPPAGPGLVPTPKLSVGEQQTAALEALQVLKALQSVTRVGVTYPDYMRRLGDTKIAVDRVLDGVKEQELRSSIEMAMLYYGRVGHVWDAKVQKYDLEKHFRLTADDCPEARKLLDRARSEKYPSIQFDLGSSGV